MLLEYYVIIINTSQQRIQKLGNKEANTHRIQWRIGGRGARGARGPNSFDFMQFSGKFGKIVCWRPPPPPGKLAPLEILDPPLESVSLSLTAIFFLSHFKGTFSSHFCNPVDPPLFLEVCKDACINVYFIYKTIML